MKPTHSDCPTRNLDYHAADGSTVAIAGEHDGNLARPQPLELPSHEVLAQLAHDDPQAFENLRRELVDSFIDSAPAKYQPRLNGIQFRVDCERRLSRSALGSTVRVYKLMWESFLCLNRNWQELVHAKEAGESWHDSNPDPACAPRASARILKFRPGQ